MEQKNKTAMSYGISRLGGASAGVFAADRGSWFVDRGA
jgi:hypothetical protein